LFYIDIYSLGKKKTTMNENELGELVSIARENALMGNYDSSL